MNIHSKETVKKAKALIASDAHKGDHGFQGEQLKVWKKMREYNLAILKKIVSQKPVGSYLTQRCPRDVPRVEAKYRWKTQPRSDAGRNHVAHPGCAYGGVAVAVRTTKRPWSNGTAAGANWNVYVHQAHRDAQNDEYDVVDLQDRLLEAKKDVARITKAIKNF